MESQAIPTIATIRYLTALLSQADARDSLPPKSQQLSRSMKFLAHISTMLDLGAHNGTEVAVTGQLDKDKAKALIVVSENSFHPSSGGGPFDVQPTCVTPTQFKPMDIVRLPKDPDEPPSFRQHVEDLIGVLELSCKSQLHHMDVARWLTHRCYKRLSHRLEHMNRQWETNPTVTMKSWEPTDTDRKFIESHSTHTINALKFDRYQKVLNEANITTLTLNSVETAKMFLSGIANLLTSTHRLLDPKKVTFVEIDYVFKVMITLEGLLDDDVIRHIITKSSLSNEFRPRPTHKGDEDTDDDEGRFP